MMQAMMTLVRGNAALGSLRSGLPSNLTDLCACERMITEKRCRWGGVCVYVWTVDLDLDVDATGLRALECM